MKTIDNKALKAINQEILVLGYKPVFWKIFLGVALSGLLAAVILEQFYLYVLILAGIFLLFVSNGIKYQKALQSGHRFYNRKKSFFLRFAGGKKVFGVRIFVY